MLKRIICMVLVLLLLPFQAFAAQGEKKAFTLKKAEFYREEEKVERLEKGDEADLILTFESEYFKHEELKDLKDIQILHNQKTLSGSEKAEIKLLSQEGENLTFEAIFKKLTYGGTDQSFHYLLEALVGKGVKQEDKIKLSQLQGSSTGNQPVPPVTQEKPEPQGMFSRGELKALGPGEQADVVIKVQNTGSVTMKSPLVRIATSSRLLIPSGLSSRMLGDLAPGESREFSLGIKASDKLGGEKESLALRLSFSYDSGKGLRQAEQSDSLDIPMNLPKENPGAPTLLLSHKPMVENL